MRRLLWWSSRGQEKAELLPTVDRRSLGMLLATDERSWKARFFEAGAVVVADGFTWLARCIGLAVALAWGGGSCPTSALAQTPSDDKEADEVFPSDDQLDRSVVAIVRVDNQAMGRPPMAWFQMEGVETFVDRRWNRLSHALADRVQLGVVWGERRLLVTTLQPLGDPAKTSYWVWRLDLDSRKQQEPERVELLAGDGYTNLAVLRGVPSEQQEGEGSEVQGGEAARSVAIRDFLNEPLVDEDSSVWGVEDPIRMLAGKGWKWKKLTLRRESGGLPAIERNELPGGLAELGWRLVSDPAVKPWTEGTPLFDRQGRLVALAANSRLQNVSRPGRKASSHSWLPVDPTALRVLESLATGTLPSYGFLGVLQTERPSEDQQEGRAGARVADVVPGMPAERSGVLAGDWITAINGQPVRGRESLLSDLSRFPADAEILVRIERPRSLGLEPWVIDIPVTLAKKYVPSRIRSFSQLPARSWRGMTVEVPSAVPPELARWFRNPDGGATSRGLVVLEVETDSQAWRAGVRPGAHVTAVDDTPVDHPDAFDRMTRERDGKLVRLTLQRWRSSEMALVLPEGE
jgi:S1-C subfamily serine protease